MIMFRALQSTLPLVRSRTLASPASSSLVNHSIFRRLISTEVREAIQRAVESKPIVLFMKGTPAAPACGFSRAAIQVLEMQGVPHEKMRTYNVLEDDELRSGIKEFSEWPTVPQLYVEAEFLGGCDILLGMHQSGELETLLEAKNVIPKAEPSALEAQAAAAVERADSQSKLESS